ncbi:MAG: ATP-binding cassette domain-containing protein [Chloroflexota bacterium]|nr:ATP-binding cassette domain-containing protein [Chloroflexota bacterium]
MLIARLDGIGLTYGTQRIFNGLDLTLNDGEKIGLVGPNGAGKSSLLRILAGRETPTEGACTLRNGIRVAYLPQEYAEQTTAPAIDEVIGGRADLLALEAELEQVETLLADPACAADMEQMGRALERQATILERYEEEGGPRFRNDARDLLIRLGLPPESHQQSVALLSGGQRKMVGLARCLIAKPDVLLLDEPDNHLDLPGKTMLEGVIRSYGGTLILISHDRYLLDDTVAQIAELDNGRLTLYQGNYSSYMTQRELALLKQKQDYTSQQKEIKRLEEAVARFTLWANLVLDERHKKQAMNKQRQIDRMEKIERPVLERRKMGLHFRSGERGGQKVIEARHLSRSFGDEIVLADLNFTVWRGERVGVVGRNGAGKSVLVQMLLGRDTPTEGEVWIGPSIRLGHYAQQHDVLDPAEMPLDCIRVVKPMTAETAMGILGRFLFTYRQATEPIGNLSGGEKSRLQLARLMTGGANCLLLDEPTNHLDIASTEVLEEALNAYDGTVLTISHDRYFLDRICSRIYEIADGDLTEYPGGYSDYVEQKARKTESPSPPAPLPQGARGAGGQKANMGSRR